MDWMHSLIDRPQPNPKHPPISPKSPNTNQAAVDVEANFFVVLAFRYTSITSIMLLDCFSIPCAMLLSCLFLGSRYRPLHLAGVALCVAGLCLTVLSDRIVPTKGGAHDQDWDTYPHALLGDVFCLIGAALYAASNVMQEALVKAHDRAEFLGMLGAYGAALSFMQVRGRLSMLSDGTVYGPYDWSRIIECTNPRSTHPVPPPPNTYIQAVILEWLGPRLCHEAQEPGAESHWARDTLYTLGFAATLAVMYSLTAYFLTEVRRGVTVAAFVGLNDCVWQLDRNL